MTRARTDHGSLAPGRVPPGPPRTATFGLLRDLIANRLRLLSSAAEQYGDAVRMPIGPKTLYLFNHPDLAKHVLSDNAANYHKGIGLVQAKRALGDGLLTSEGELWRTQRRTIQPTFHRRRIAAQSAVVAKEAAALVARLRSAARPGAGPVDVVAEMAGFTLGVLGRTLLDADLGRFDDVGHSFEAVQDQAMFEMVSLSIVPTWVPLPKQVRFRRARRELERVVRALVTERDERPGQNDDVLSRLITSARAESDPAVGQRRMRDELVTLLLAGHETTASTLSWTLHLVGGHQDVWLRLRDEARSVLGDRLPDHEDLARLPYTMMVVHEAMRLYPPVWILTRKALAEDTIGGYRVPAGADVLVCPYTMHRHPEFWDAPERFDPERFNPEQTANRSNYAYLPFGAGPRYCIGNRLGLMEAVFVLALLSRELHLSTVPGYRVVPEPMLSLRIRGGLPMIVRDAG